MSTIDGDNKGGTSSTSSIDAGGGRAQRQRRPSAKARDMEEIDMDRIIKRLVKGKEVVLPDSDDDEGPEQEEEGDEKASSAGASSSSKGGGKRRAVMMESDGGESGDDSDDSDLEEEEEYDSEEEEAQAKKKLKAQRKALGLTGEWRRRETGSYYYYIPELPPPPKRFRMDNFTDSEPSPLLTEIFNDPLLVRDLFITPGLLSATHDLQALGATCTVLSPLLGAAAIKLRTTKWERRTKDKTALAPNFVGEAGKETTVTVDFTTSALAFPARFISGLGRPRGQGITHLTLLNLTGELCYELADVFEGPGMPHLVSLTLGGGKDTPFSAINNKRGGLLPTLFTAPHAKLPKLTALCLDHLTVSASTWRILTAMVRKMLSPALKDKRALALALPPKPTAPDSPSSTSAPTTSSVTTPATTTTATGSVGSAGTGAKKKPGASKKSAAAPAKKGEGKGQKKQKVQAKKALPLAPAPSPLLRCTELQLKGGGGLVDLLLGRRRCPLKELVLEDTRAHAQDLSFLAKAIEEGVLPTLTGLAVVERELTDATAAAIVDGLAVGCQAVTALSLGQNAGWGTPAPALVQSLLAAAKGTDAGGSGPGLASLERLSLSWPGLSENDRNALLPCLLGIDTFGGLGASRPLAFPALKALGLSNMRTLRPHLLALLKAAFRRKITDLDFSHCGGDKAAVTAMVEEAKRSIPTLGLPEGQPVKLTLIQFNTRVSYWGGNAHRFTHSECYSLERGLKGRWKVVFAGRF